MSASGDQDGLSSDTEGRSSHKVALISASAVVTAALIGLVGVILGKADVINIYAGAIPTVTVTMQVTPTQVPTETPTETPTEVADSSVDMSAAPGASVALGDLPGDEVVLGNFSRVGSVQVNSYDAGIAWIACSYCIWPMTVVLNRKYSTFTAHIGAKSDSTAGLNGRVRNFADGKKIYDKPINVGTSYEPTLHVDNVLQLQIQVQAVKLVDSQRFYYVIGDPLGTTS
jgi:hypothetical protein